MLPALTGKGFDFTGYQPGDVFCVSRSDLARHGMAMTFVALAELSKAADKAGLLIEPTFDDHEMRVIFK